MPCQLIWRWINDTRGLRACTILATIPPLVRGYIAQWLERLTADQQVPGSNPGVPFSREWQTDSCDWLVAAVVLSLAFCENLADSIGAAMFNNNDWKLNAAFARVV